MTIPALIMLAPPGESEIEYWISSAQRAAALDLVLRLNEAELIDPVYVFAADQNFAQPLAEAGAIVQGTPVLDFHFGQQLRLCVEYIASDRLAYFGAASAPLLPLHWIDRIAAALCEVRQPWACVNNFHSTDWAFFNHSTLLAAADQHIPSDNSLGWVARNLCGFEIAGIPAAAASRADLDTPADLFMVTGHPDLGLHLHRFLDSNLPVQQKAAGLKSLLSKPAKTLALIGRVSSEASRVLEKATQIWTRVFAEERGMVASGRLSRGEVTSMTGRMLAAWGPHRFVQELESMADGVLWDTRVVMAELYGWPSGLDRFAFDLGRSDLLEQESLTEWCEAVRDSAIPILSGGHSVVSGGLLALLESACPELRPEFELHKMG